MHEMKKPVPAFLWTKYYQLTHHAVPIQAAVKVSGWEMGRLSIPVRVIKWPGTERPTAASPVTDGDTKNLSDSALMKAVYAFAVKCEYG